jgi:hypothetical protein
VTGEDTGYARPMPALGFDPAPGDVASTTALARRYAEIAAEITAVQNQVTGIDLARWEGKAAAVARTRQAALVQALAQAADTTTSLSEAAASWSPRLATYQAEAGALERQAAGEQANQRYLATRVPQVPQLTSDLAESATALSAIPQASGAAPPGVPGCCRQHPDPVRPQGLVGKHGAVPDRA